MMKVFFHASPFAKTYDPQLTAIYDEIIKLGYTHVNDETKTHDVRSILTNKEKPFSKEQYSKHVELLINNIRSADICVFDVTHQSLGVGYLVEKSLQSFKPTVILYYKDHIPYIFTYVQDEKLIVQNYDDNNLKKSLKKTLDQAREKRDKRFNFFLSPKLLNYLESVSTDQGVTKSKILRDLIVEHMRNKPEVTA